MTDTGIVLNDELDDFGIPGQINAFGYAASPANCASILTHDLIAQMPPD